MDRPFPIKSGVALLAQKRPARQTNIDPFESFSADAHIMRGTPVLHRLANGQRIQPEMSRHPLHQFLAGRRSLTYTAPAFYQTV